MPVYLPIYYEIINLLLSNLIKLIAKEMPKRKESAVVFLRQEIYMKY